ncbi:MAG: hypothetical protein COW00_14015 [Bdellovibrio sp. CG12_big_fil_rev_8_21_14_0_65_39_13]|nr:MAG: hypothetical protein COW78_07440 [Bdellovibrio sp. CG22_combo_CG10-13_8_21_14_all_39_27]PIQ58729.1 MAG: hypothetical protein COW00_14015 [Bdellovibrio sp. CG12_big_fil_rev_8_21_14_0_65_39_13]PIR33104.1 MAG: hypothetical protein COV37_18610 [Bdellovibrio sp. CG11_big_fil_rev_8_21_14_0_20_39_38]PJB53054.1 MAG: hypothetical protein CO099_09330 [Bdellovibrio sp. CG_4_9_14_3_um_filter_39_7]
MIIYPWGDYKVVKVSIFWNIQTLKVTQPNWGEEFEFGTSPEAAIMFSDNLEELKASSCEKKIYVCEDFQQDLVDEEISQVSPELIKDIGFSTLLMRGLSETGSIHLEEILGEKITKITNFKMIDTKVRGQYTDLLSDIVERGGHSSLRIGQWFNQVTLYLSYLEEKGIALFPIDVDCVVVSNSMIVQLSVPVENFYKDYVTKAFSPDASFESPFINSLYHLEVQAQGNDITYLESNKVVLISGHWNRSVKNFTPGLIFHSVPRFEAESKKEYNSYRLEQIKEAALKGQISLPGSSVEMHELSAFEKSANTVQIKQMVKFFKENGDLSNITIEGMGALAESYYKVKGGSRLSPQELKMTFQALTDPDTLDELNTVINSLDSTLPLGEEITRVGGLIEEMDLDELIRITGQAQAPEEKTRISGVTQKLTTETWKVKRLEVAEKLEKELSKKKNVTAADVRETLNSIFEESMGFSSANLVDSIAEEGLAGAQKNWSRVSGSDITSQQKISQLDSALKSRNIMIAKMKNLLEEMKSAKQASAPAATSIITEVDANRTDAVHLDQLRQSNGELLAAKARYEDEIRMLKQEINTQAAVISQNQNNEAKVEKSAGNFELTIQSKNQQLEKVTSELRLLEDTAKALNIKVKSLEQKNKILQSQLEGASNEAESDATKVDTRFVQKIKQLETLNGNLQEENKKYQVELQAKKAEAHKHALENKTMKTKMHQLERQVANLSKKRAA